MRSLLWKEWHEQRWKLAFMSVLLMGIAFSGLHARVLPDETVLVSVCLLSAVLMPLLIGAVLIAPEREARTLDTLLALPTPRISILGIKTLVGIMLCLVPLGMTCVLSLAMAGGREMASSAIVAMFVRCVLTMLSYYFWMLTLTIRLPGETRATLLSLGILIAWNIISLGLSEAGDAGWARTLWLCDPTVFLAGNLTSNWPEGIPTIALLEAAIAQSAIAGGLWFWAIRLFAAEEARS